MDTELSVSREVYDEEAKHEVKNVSGGERTHSQLCSTKPSLHTARRSSSFQIMLCNESLPGLYSLAMRWIRKASSKDAFQEAIRLNPENAEAHGILGVMLINRKADMDAAVDYLRKAIRLGPERAVLYQHLGFALNKKCEFDDAIDAFLNGIRVQIGECQFTQRTRHILYGQG